jgi:hypothetical protein
MRSSILTAVFVSMLLALAAGCAPSTAHPFVFEPRSYPFEPKLGLVEATSHHL